MRNARDLAVLNSVSSAVAKVDGVESVNSITQPDGERLAPASIAAQLGRIAKGLDKADRKLKDGEPGLERLVTGSEKFGDGIGQVADGSGKAQNGAGKLGEGSRRLTGGLDKSADGSADAADGSRKLRDGADELAVGLRTAHDQVAIAVDGMGQIVQALTADPVCTADPICKRSRESSTRSTPGSATSCCQAWPRLPTAPPAFSPTATAIWPRAWTGSPAGCVRRSVGSARIASGQEQLSSKLGELSGTETLAQKSEGLSPALGKLQAQTKKLQSGLDDSGDYLPGRA